MKKLFILFIGLTLVGCGESEPSTDNITRYISYDRVITDDHRTEAAAWITATLAAAKSPADKDPEDSIAAVEKAAFNIFGTPTIGISVCSNSHWEFVPYEHLSPDDKVWCDKYLANSKPKAEK